jgi:hypothetical protein
VCTPPRGSATRRLALLRNAPKGAYASSAGSFDASATSRSTPPRPETRPPSRTTPNITRTTPHSSQPAPTSTAPHRTGTSTLDAPSMPRLDTPFKWRKPHHPGETPVDGRPPLPPAHLLLAPCDPRGHPTPQHPPPKMHLAHPSCTGEDLFNLTRGSSRPLTHFLTLIGKEPAEIGLLSGGTGLGPSSSAKLTKSS